MLATGTTTASERRPITAPANRAAAATGEKFCDVRQQPRRDAERDQGQRQQQVGAQRTGARIGAVGHGPGFHHGAAVYHDGPI